MNALGGLFGAALAGVERAPGDGALVMAVAARTGEGVSTIVRDAASEAGASMYIVDLDMKRNGQAKYFTQHGGLGPAQDGRVGGKSLVRVLDRTGAPLPAAFHFHRANAADVHVSLLEAPAKARVQISQSAAYWQALRATGANVLVDACALDRNELALKLAPYMDAVVLVVAADAGAAPPAMAARAALAKAGGRVAGLVFARASAEQIAIDRMTRLAG